MTGLDPISDLALPQGSIRSPESPRTIVVKKNPAWRFDILVPVNVFEWFVTAYHDGAAQPTWENWLDYSGYEDSPDDPHILARRMRGDIQWFLDQIYAADDFRLVSSHKGIVSSTRQLEWLHVGTWEPVRICPGS